MRLTPSERRPHALYRRRDRGDATLHPDYPSAFRAWLGKHTHAEPYVVGTVSREIEPDAPVIDVGE